MAEGAGWAGSAGFARRGVRLFRAPYAGEGAGAGNWAGDAGGAGWDAGAGGGLGSARVITQSRYQTL